MMMMGDCRERWLIVTDEFRDSSQQHGELRPQLPTRSYSRKLTISLDVVPLSSATRTCHKYFVECLLIFQQHDQRTCDRLRTVVVGCMVDVVIERPCLNTVELRKTKL